MRSAKGLITALSPSAEGISANFTAFENFAAHPPLLGMQEVREQMIAFAARVVQSQQTTNEDKQRAVLLAITEMQKQVAAYPLDTREHLQLAQAYRIAGDNASALKEIQEAALLSPGKEEIWIQAGAIEWDLGTIEAAQASFNKAYALGPQFPDLALYAAAGDIAVGDIKKADQILLDAYGSENVDSDVLAAAYYRTQNWPRLIAMSTLRAEKPDANADSWFSLAAVYYAAGDKANAINTIKTTIKRYPDAAAAGAAALKQIEGQAAGQ